MSVQSVCVYVHSCFLFVLWCPPLFYSIESSPLCILLPFSPSACASPLTHTHRISSGSELGAYYHPYFRRDQPHLLPLINTMDEIPIERYGVNVTNVVTFGAAGAAGGGYCADSSNVGGGGNNGGGTTTFVVDQPPVSSSNLKQDGFVPTAAAVAASSFNPILKTTVNTEADDDSIHSASLSLGSISPISVSRGVSLTAEEVDPSLLDNLVLPFKEGNTDDDDDVTLESLEDDALLDHLESKICGGEGVVAPCAAKIGCESSISDCKNAIRKFALIFLNFRHFFRANQWWKYFFNLNC